MHIAKGVARTDLALSRAEPQLRNYVAELERELERTQARNHRLRQNIRSMQAKLQVAHLQERLAAYQQERLAECRQDAAPMRAVLLGSTPYRDAASG